MIKSINPATGEDIQTYPEMEIEEIEKILSLTKEAQINWQKSDFGTRKKNMLQAAALLRKKNNSLSELMTAEMGKPINQSKSEIEKCA